MHCWAPGRHRVAGDAEGSAAVQSGRGPLCRKLPREMLSGGIGSYHILNGVAYIEKPPLQYWATAISLRVFGQTEFGARLYTALAALPLHRRRMGDCVCSVE